MSRSHKKALSVTDAKKSIGNYYRSNNLTPLHILNNLRSGLIGQDQAVKNFAKTNTPLGWLLAGQVYLESAIRPKKNYQSQIYINNAGEMFNRCINMNVNNFRDKYTDLSYQFRALVHTTLLPTYYFLTDKKLPPNNVTENMYSNLLNVGKKMVDEYFREKNNTDEDNIINKSKLYGLISEVGVLALLQRFSIKEDGIGSDTYTATLTTFSDDFRNKSGSTINHASDINVYTKLSDNDPTTLSYAVQVKSNKYQGTYEINPNTIRMEDEKGISRIYLNPDLKLGEWDKFVGSNILSECYGETENKNFTQKLDERTERLLENLDNN